MLDNLGKRTVEDVIGELRKMNAATAEISGRKADGTPVFAVIFVQGEPSTAEVLELLANYSDDDAEELEKRRAAVLEAAGVVTDTTDTLERGLRLEELGFAVAELRELEDRKAARLEALEARRRAEEEDDEGDGEED